MSTMHATNNTKPGRSMVKGASTFDEIPDSLHDTISPRFCCCLFSAYRNFSDFLRGNVSYNGKIVE